MIQFKIVETQYLASNVLRKQCRKRGRNILRLPCHKGDAAG